MRRIVTIPLILLVGSLVLWEVVAQGTRTWTKYGILKQPLPSLTTLIPTTSMIQSIIMLLTTTIVIVVLVVNVLRSRKLFGLIPMSELLRHVVILGPTGSGKTSTVKAIIEKVLRSGSAEQVVVIDWKGEYSQFIPTATVIKKIPNIWNIPGGLSREKALVAVELIREMSKDVIDISPPSALLLLRILEEEYRKGVPTTETIMAILEKSARIAQREGRHAEANMYFALLRRLYVILADQGRQAQNVEGDPRIVVYDLARLPNIYMKTLYANYILARLYRSATKADASERLKTLVIAEEAQNYMPARRPGDLPTIAERIVYELRSFGIGVVLVCPDPELLPTPVLKDVGAIVAMSPDSLPRFALERYLFRASLEEAEKTLKKLMKTKMVVYYKGKLHFFRRLPKPPKILKVRPKGDPMGVTHPWAGGRSLRAWPILPHRSPGRPKIVEVEEDVEERPKVIEVELEAEAEKPKAVEVAKLAEEEEKGIVEEEMPMVVEPEPAPKGPPIPSSLPYRGSLCPAGRSATLGRVLF